MYVKNYAACRGCSLCWPVRFYPLFYHFHHFQAILGHMEPHAATGGDGRKSPLLPWRVGLGQSRGGDLGRRFIYKIPDSFRDELRILEHRVLMVGLALQGGLVAFQKACLYHGDGVPRTVHSRLKSTLGSTGCSTTRRGPIEI